MNQFLMKERRNVRISIFRKILLLVTLGVVCQIVYAQKNVAVKGVVISTQTGTPIVGASVVVKGDTRGVTTNDKGEFFLDKLSDNAILVASFLGYKECEIKVGKTSNLVIQLDEDAKGIAEVVVVGYGTSNKKDLTTSVTQVNSRDFYKGAMNNPLQAIAGKVAGVSITSTAMADPNSGANVQIRGAASFEAGNNPLVVIDGVVGGNLAILSQDDIESITILKDGGAAAIYGSRGANGVVLIQTKRGHSGKLQVSYNGYVGIDAIAAKPDVLSASEFVEHNRDTDFGYATNWYDKLIRRNNYSHNHNFSMSGGSDNAIFRFSANYKDAKGIDIASAREEMAVRGSFVGKWWDGVAEFSSTVSYKKTNEDYTDYGAFNQAIKINPTVAEDDYDYFISRADESHPVRTLKERINTASNEYLSLDGRLKINFTKDLNAEMILSRQVTNREGKYYLYSYAKECQVKGYNGKAQLEHNDWVDNHLEFVINYSKQFGKHNVKVMAGYSYEDYMNQGYNAENMNFISDAMLWNNIGAGDWNKKDGLLGMGSWKSTETAIAFFGRANYNFKNLVLATATFRYEGNSKFGENEKWGLFPSASIAWRLSEMKWFDSAQWMDDLKIRFSYGVTGRSGFARYATLPIYMLYRPYLAQNGTWINAWGPQNNPNANLRWEKQISYNAGVDFSFFDMRFKGSVDFFRRVSKDLIAGYDAPVPPFIHTSVTTNVGTNISQGVELQLMGNIVNRKNFRYDIHLIASYTKAWVDSFSNNIYSKDYVDRYQLPAPGNPGSAQRMEPGRELGMFYGFEYAGVDSNGNILIKERDENGKLTGNTILGSLGTEKDKTYLGHGAPHYQLTLVNTFAYKNWDLSLSFRGRFDYKILNLQQMYYGLQGEPGTNLLRDAYTRNGHIKSPKVYCDYFLENGNYLKLDNITLGYDFKFKKFKYISNIYLYASITNVFTITKYTGLDPDSVEINGLEPGISSLSLYPTTRNFSLGVKINF